MALCQLVWGAIRAHVKPQQKTMQIKGKRVRLAGVPAFAEQTEAFDVPEVALEARGLLGPRPRSPI